MRRFQQALTGLVAVVCCAFALHRLIPQVGHGGGTNSDMSIPQLMINADRFRLHSLYFWGQDRIGGWPYISTWLMGVVTAHRWSVAELYGLQYAALIVAAFALGSLAGRWRWLLLVSVVAVFAFNGSARREGLEIGEWHIPQLLALSLAWVFLRRLAEQEAASGPIRSWFPAAFWSFLAIWSAPFSLLYLLVIGVVEAERAGTRRWPLIRPALVGLGAELTVRVVYNVDALTRHYWFQRTGGFIDFGHFLGNGWHWVSYLIDTHWWPFAVLSIASLVLFAVARQNFSRDLMAIAAAAACIAFINLALCSIFGWMRTNGFSDRYLVTTVVFLVISSIALIAAILDRISTRDFLPVAVALVASACVVLFGPPAQAVGNAADVDRAATWLPQHFPDAILVGCYWDTYRFVDGTVAHPLRPIVLGKRWNRMSWLLPELHDAKEVIASLHDCPALGSENAPLNHVEMHGVPFDRDATFQYESGPFRFARYVRATAP